MGDHAPGGRRRSSPGRLPRPCGSHRLQRLAPRLRFTSRCSRALQASHKAGAGHPRWRPCPSAPSPAEAPPTPSSGWKEGPGLARDLCPHSAAPYGRRARPGTDIPASPDRRQQEHLWRGREADAQGGQGSRHAERHWRQTPHAGLGARPEICSLLPIRLEDAVEKGCQIGKQIK